MCYNVAKDSGERRKKYVKRIHGKHGECVINSENYAIERAQIEYAIVLPPYVSHAIIQVGLSQTYKPH